MSSFCYYYTCFRKLFDLILVLNKISDTLTAFQMGYELHRVCFFFSDYFSPFPASHPMLIHHYSPPVFSPKCWFFNVYAFLPILVKIFMYFGQYDMKLSGNNVLPQFPPDFASCWSTSCICHSKFWKVNWNIWNFLKPIRDHNQKNQLQKLVFLIFYWCSGPLGSRKTQLVPVYQYFMLLKYVTFRVMLKA